VGRSIEETSSEVEVETLDPNSAEVSPSKAPGPTENQLSVLKQVQFITQDVYCMRPAFKHNAT